MNGSTITEPKSNIWGVGKVLLGIVIALVLIGAALYGQYGSTSVCGQCGTTRKTVEWQVPFAQVTILRHSAEHETPVSQIIVRNRIVPPHQHTWRFVYGSGNGITCAIGGGRYILPTMESDGVTKIIGAAQRFGALAFRDRILRNALDPNTSDAVRTLGLSVPAAGFASAPEFETWLKKEQTFFDESVSVREKE